MAESYLPIIFVISACETTLEEIEICRSGILAKLVGERFTKWYWKIKPPSAQTLHNLKYMLPDGDKEIAYMHRSSEESSIRKIMDLSQHTLKTTEYSKILLDHEDFSLIIGNYKGGKTRC